MKEKQVNLLHEIMQQENAVLAYVGSFSQDTVKSMLKYIESRLEGSGVQDQVRKKIFNVMTEMLQNITKHQKDSKDDSSAVFVMGENEKGYYMLTGNEAPVSIVNKISSRLTFINNLDKEALKEHYKKARLESTISEVGGAGLGFIDIVRKSENPIQFKFIPTGADSTFFILKSTINHIS